MPSRVYWVVGSLAILSACGVYYWQARFFLDAGTPGRHELQVGAALVALYTWPAWVGFPAYALWIRKALNNGWILLSFLPAALICVSFTISSIGFAS